MTRDGHLRGSITVGHAGSLHTAALDAIPLEAEPTIGALLAAVVGAAAFAAEERTEAWSGRLGEQLVLF
jgi:hypothetical protein